MSDMRTEIHEGLANLNHKAKREIRCVGNDRLPTPWDRRHAGLNHLLDQLDILDEIDEVTKPHGQATAQDA